MLMFLEAVMRRKVYSSGY